MCLSPYNDLKSAVWNCSYVSTNLILDHMISLGKEAFELTSLQMSGFLFAHPSNYQLIHPPTSLSGIHPPSLLAISILPPTYHPTYPPTHQSIHLFLHPPTHSFPIHLPICPPSACPFIHPLSYLLTWGTVFTDNFVKHLSSQRSHWQCMSY